MNNVPEEIKLRAKQLLREYCAPICIRCIGEGVLKYPYKGAWDGQYLWVSDLESHQVFQLNQNGQVSGIFGEPGAKHGQLNRPTEIKLGRDRRIYVCDYWNNRVEVYDPSGRYNETLWEGKVISIELDHPNRRVFIADNDRRQVIVVEMDEGRSEQVGAIRHPLGKFPVLHALLLGPQGVLYILAESEIYRASTRSIEGEITASIFTRRSNAPANFRDFVWKDPDGLFVANFTNLKNPTLIKYDISGRLIYDIPLLEEGTYHHATGLFWAERDLYVCIPRASKVCQLQFL